MERGLKRSQQILAWETAERRAHSMSTVFFGHRTVCAVARLITPRLAKLYSTTYVKKAGIKARLLVQRYPLATSYTAGRKKQDIILCPLCKADRETMTHFLLQCEATDILRWPLMREILQICKKYRAAIEHEHLLQKYCWTQTVLNVSQQKSSMDLIVLCKMFSGWFFANKKITMTIRTLKFGDVTYNVMS